MEQDNTGSAVADGPTALSDIFARREPMETQAEPAGQAEPQAEPQAAPETGEKGEQPRDEAGKFAPKEAPPAAEKDAERGLIAARQAEARKRQDAERERDEARRELAEIRARPAAPQAPPVQHAPQQPATPPVPLEDMLFQDPGGFIRTFEERQDKALRDTRIAMSVSAARERFPDYAEAEAELERYARTSHAAAMEVANLLNNDPAPAMVAYQAGKHLLAQKQWQPIMQQHGNPDAFIAAEVERRVQERLAEQAPSVPNGPAHRLPTSLAGARASQGRSASNFAGATPLTAIFAQRR